VSTEPKPPAPEEIEEGAAVYTRALLAWYDMVALGLVCPLVWGCPRKVMKRLHDAHVGERHLDLGPGTGFFLRKCRWPVAAPRVVLVDLNAQVLRKASRKLRAFNPKAVRRDVLQPLDLGDEQFDSVGMNMLLHCIPGGMHYKAKVFDQVLPYLAPGGRIFGATVLSEGVDHRKAAPKFLEQVNNDGIFHNRGDSLDQLDAELSARFDDYELTSRGSMGIFSVRVPGGTR